jgi:hypothetical protein
MFNNKRVIASRDDNSGKHDLSSGWNIRQSFKNYNTYRDELQDCFTLNESDANLETVEEYGQIAGQARGFNTYLAKASKAKLDAARGMMNVMRTMITHNQQAVSMEAQLQQSEMQAIEGLEKSLIDLKYTQAQYDGFTTHATQARDIVIY